MRRWRPACSIVESAHRERYVVSAVITQEKRGTTFRAKGPLGYRRGSPDCGAMRGPAKALTRDPREDCEGATSRTSADLAMAIVHAQRRSDDVVPDVST